MPALRSRPFWIWSGVALLALLVAAMVAPAWSGPFVFDDTTNLAGESRLAAGRWGQFVLREPADSGSTLAGRPVGRLSVAISAALTGHDPASYRLGNGVLHWAGALLLWRISAEVLRRRASVRSTNIEFTAWGVAALWAVHPLQVSTVNYAVQRVEVQAGFLMWLSIWAAVRALRSHGHLWHGIAVSAGWLAAGTKETAVVLPVLVWLLDRAAGVPRPRWRMYALLGSVALPVGLLTLLSGGRGGTAGFDAGLPVWNYLCTQAEALVTYVKLIVVPAPLVFDYGTAVAGGLGDVWFEALLVAVAMSLISWALVRGRDWALAGAWFAVALAPTSSIIPVASQTMAEHRLYLALAGPLAGLVFWAARRSHTTTLVIVAVVGATWIALSVDRARVFRSEFELWRDTVAARPLNSRARINFGLALHRSGDPARALEEFEHAARQDPKAADAFFNAGVVHAQAGRREAAQAAYRRALDVRPTHAEAHNNLGVLALASGLWLKAEREFAAAVATRPDYAEAWSNLSLAQLEQRRAPEALLAAQRAVQLDPGAVEALFNWGNALAANARFAEARDAYARVLQRQPGHLRAQANLANVYIEQEDFEAALRELDAVLAQRPDDLAALRNSGTILAIQGRRWEALSRFESILRLRPDDEVARDAVRRLRMDK